MSDSARALARLRLSRQPVPVLKYKVLAQCFASPLVAGCFAFAVLHGVVASPQFL
jgi:hypothetical protein